MQIKDQTGVMENYRPPQTCLNYFWTLTEGDDESRVEAAIQLVKMIQSVEKKSEREELTTYCVNRLVRGLGSGRKFARVGFSTALTLLLRLQTEVKTAQVLACLKEKLKAERNAFSKSEKAALYMGRAFAISAIIQSGRASKLTDEILNNIIGDLLSLSDKRSFLRPVCSKALEDLIAEVSEKSFADTIWPRVREKLVLGWEGCTLDRISLLLVCKEKYPDIVNKKFIKKHWGSSVFSEDNDEKLFQAIQNSTEKSSVLREKILPCILNSGRDLLSIWKSFGEKMLSSGKGVISQQQLIALEILSQLISLSPGSQEILSLIVDPSVTKAIFFENHTDNDALGRTLNSLVQNLCDKLKAVGGDILSFVEKVLELEGNAEDDAQTGKLCFIHSNNFNKIVSLMNKTEMEKYIEILIEFVKGKDKNLFFSPSAKKRKKQQDWCFRQLQYVTCSQTHTTVDIQRSVLALFLRNGFFTGDKKVSDVLHCDFVDKFVESNDVKKLCELFLFKSLDQLSTMKVDQNSKTESFSRYTDLLSYLVHYFQTLLNCQAVVLVPSWSEETHSIWKELIKRINSLEKGKTKASPAFRLLYLYMAFYLLTDFKTATDLLKDLFICHDKSDMKEKKSKKTEDSDDPPWVEVLTEMLLQLLSLHSHLARVIAARVFDMILPHINAGAVTLITQILIPNKNAQNLMFEENEEDGEEDVDENGDLLDEDIPSEASDEEDDDNDSDDDDDNDGQGKGEDEEEEDEGDDKMDVDEQFRASVKEVLGNAAVEDDDNDDDDEDDLPDLSDSEMFKFDEALAEVFRQRKRKFGGKKAKEEKRKEMGNFRLRALDLVDVLIKSDRCGDFLLDLLKPLLVLMFTSTRAEEQAACSRAKSSFQTLKSKCKGITDPTRLEEEQMNLFQELIDLAKHINDSSQLQQIAAACVLVIKVSKANCLSMLQENLTNIINKKQSKPAPSFFIALLDTDPVVFKPLCTDLIDCLKNESVKKQCKSMACTLLTTLVKKGGSAKETKSDKDGSWLELAAAAVCELVGELDKETARGLLVKELLTLTLALLGRTDILSSRHFDSDIKQKLLEIKSKMGTDTRRLTNKIIAALDRLSKEGDKINGQKEKSKQSGKKRKAEEIDIDSPQPKKKKKKKSMDADN